MDGVWSALYFSFSYLYDHFVGDKEVGGEGSMMIELCVKFNDGLSEDDVTYRGCRLHVLVLGPT